MVRGSRQHLCKSGLNPIKLILTRKMTNFVLHIFHAVPQFRLDFALFPSNSQSMN